MNKNCEFENRFVLHMIRKGLAEDEIVIIGDYFFSSNIEKRKTLYRIMRETGIDFLARMDTMKLAVLASKLRGLK